MQTTPTDSIHTLVGLKAPHCFAEKELVDPTNHSRTMLILHSMVERAVKTTFAAMMTQQVNFLDEQQETFFSLVSKRFADTHRQYTEAQEILCMCLKESGDDEAVAAFQAFEVVTRLRNRLVHGAYLNYDKTVEELSDGKLKLTDVWLRAEAVVEACFEQVQRVPEGWSASEAEQMAEPDPMEGYEAWRGK